MNVARKGHGACPLTYEQLLWLWCNCLFQVSVGLDWWCGGSVWAFFQGYSKLATWGLYLKWPSEKVLQIGSICVHQVEVRPPEVAAVRWTAKTNIADDDIEPQTGNSNSTFITELSYNSRVNMWTPAMTIKYFSVWFSLVWVWRLVSS